MRALVATAVALARARVFRAEAEVSPIQKVVHMLQDMLATGETELKAEQVSFAEFKQFCEDTKAQKAESIAKQKQQIESLAANTQEYKAKADEHGRTVASLNGQLGEQEEDLQSQKDERAKEHSEFQEQHRDFSESVDALVRAIAILKQQDYDRGASFLQAKVMIPAKARRLVESFIALRQDPNYLDREAPEANAYEFQSGGIIGMIEKLLDEFKTKVNDAEKAEMNAKHAFEMAEQDLSDAIASTKEQIEEHSAAAQRARGSQAQSQKAFDSAQVARREDSKFLNDLKVECADKMHSFIEKQKLRKDELEALQKAIEILGSASIGSSASKRAMFLQMTQPWAKKISTLLMGVSQKFGDPRFSLLAQHASADPFKKVKVMIRDMIDRLLQEANEEAEKKGFCDKEMQTNKITREKLQGQLDITAAQLEENLTRAQRLVEETAALQQEVSLLNEQRTAAVSQRQAEHEKNVQTIKDAKDAQVAVAQARAVLVDFYAKAGQATAFIQLHRPTMGSPEWNALADPDHATSVGYGQGSEDKVDKGHKAGMQTYGATYQGQQDSAGGVLGMLDVIASDFANLQGDTESQEASAQRDHDQFMADTKQDIAVKEKQVELKTQSAQEAKSRAHALKSDWNSTDDQLLAANRYFDELKPQCLVKVTYEDRVKRREEEIASLKEALEILHSVESQQ